MAEKATPLAQRVPIVDKDGYPTPYFQRQWEAVLRELAEFRARLTALDGGP